MNRRLQAGVKLARRIEERPALLNAVISGWGARTPERILRNQELESMVDTSDAWIVSRTGIRERHIAGPEETGVSMGFEAAQQALDRASVSAEELDLIIFASTTPDQLLPGSGCLVQRKLGAHRAAAFDLNAACSGFLYAVSVASQFLRTGTCRRVLVVCAEVLSRFVNWKDRGTCVLFGDGAAAVVLEASSKPVGLLSFVLGSHGDAEGMLTIQAGGSARPASAETVAAGDHHVRMRGNEVFKMAVRNMTAAAREALGKVGLTVNDLKAVIPHQANRRILTATQESLGLPAEKMFINVDRYGNTGAASIPIALSEYLELHPPEAGDDFLFVSFGGGLTWGAAVLRWSD